MEKEFAIHVSKFSHPSPYIIFTRNIHAADHSRNKKKNVFLCFEVLGSGISDVLKLNLLNLSVCIRMGV